MIDIHWYTYASQTQENCALHHSLDALSSEPLRSKKRNGGKMPALRLPAVEGSASLARFNHLSRAIRAED
jgi:hypothetical protein